MSLICRSPTWLMLLLPGKPLVLQMVDSIKDENIVLSFRVSRISVLGKKLPADGDYKIWKTQTDYYPRSVGTAAGTDHQSASSNLVQTSCWETRIWEQVPTSGHSKTYPFPMGFSFTYTSSYCIKSYVLLSNSCTPMCHYF